MKVKSNLFNHFKTDFLDEKKPLFKNILKKTTIMLHISQLIIIFTK